MSGRVIVLCGPQGSGKGVVAGRAVERGIAVLSLGDVVRAQVAADGLEANAANVGSTALSMREEWGEAVVVERLLPMVHEALEAADVLIDGMRQPLEFDRLVEDFAEVEILSLEATDEARQAWLAGRGRGEDESGFGEREKREWAWGLAELMARARVTIVNNGSFDDLLKSADQAFAALGG